EVAHESSRQIKKGDRRPAIAGRDRRLGRPCQTPGTKQGADDEWRIARAEMTASRMGAGLAIRNGSVPPSSGDLDGFPSKTGRRRRSTCGVAPRHVNFAHT